MEYYKIKHFWSFRQQIFLCSLLPKLFISRPAYCCCKGCVCVENWTQKPNCSFWIPLLLRHCYAHISCTERKVPRRRHCLRTLESWLSFGTLILLCSVYTYLLWLSSQSCFISFTSLTPSMVDESHTCQHAYKFSSW